MIRRIVGESLLRRRRRKILSLVAITLGIAVATTLATMAVDVGDKVNHELRSIGANIVVIPAADGFPISLGGVDFRPAGAGAYLNEADLPNLKRIFWRNSIVAFAPFVYVPARFDGRRVVLIGTWFDHSLAVTSSFTTGVRQLYPAWKVTGAWPSASNLSTCLVGSQLARSLSLKPGDNISIEASGAAGSTLSKTTLHVAGIVETGGAEEQEIIAPLATVQRLSGLEGKVRRVEVSALTKPDDQLSRTPAARMTSAQFERWSCSNYASTVAYQLQQAIPGSSAKPVYRISETEGQIMNRVGLLMGLLAAAALLTAALAVASMMLANVLERRAEIGLLKALGATDARVAAIFLGESSVVGLAGGLAGYALGSALAERLAWAVFGTGVSIHWVILPGALALALVVTLIGSAVPLGRGLKMTAAVALRNE
ncbi:MAG: ABC transporter permease [Terriglobia bacterium]